MDGGFLKKLFYRIGDVSEITGIKPHVLRYWEEEFKGLHPRKNRAGQRIYERRDVELVLAIKKLLYEQRYTISGARKLLDRQARQISKQVAPAQADSHKRVPPSQAAAELSDALNLCRRELRTLLMLLDHRGHQPGVEGQGNGG